MPSKLRRYDEYGHVHFLTISCYRRLPFFRHNPVRKLFVDGMRHTETKLGIRWLGYVVMPEHVHLLLFPIPVGSDELVRVSVVLQTLKQYVGRNGKEALRAIWRTKRSLGTTAMDAWALGSGSKPFWKTRAYDFNVTNENTLHSKLDYMHRNPITRCLVEQAEQWIWSSYRYYEYDDDSVIGMNWDGSWPIV